MGRYVARHRRYFCRPSSADRLWPILPAVTLLPLFLPANVLFYLSSRLSSRFSVSALMLLLSILSAGAAVFQKSAVTLRLPYSCVKCHFSGVSCRYAVFLYILAPLALVLFSNPALLFRPIFQRISGNDRWKRALQGFDYLLSQFPVVIKYLQLFILQSPKSRSWYGIKSSFLIRSFIVIFILVALLMTAIFFIVRGEKQRSCR